jgi:hypothetical protein
MVRDCLPHPRPAPGATPGRELASFVATRGHREVSRDLTIEDACTAVMSVGGWMDRAWLRTVEVSRSAAGRVYISPSEPTVRGDSRPGRPRSDSGITACPPDRPGPEDN